MSHLSNHDVKMRCQQLAEIGPKVGETWKHYKGGLYEIVARPLEEATLAPLVIYRSLKYGTVWCRTLANWTESVSIGDGCSVQRFWPAESTDA